MVQELLPLLIMVLVQFEFAGMNILSKLALDSGMNPYIHVAYRQMFASVTLGPLAYFIERYPNKYHVFTCKFLLNPSLLFYINVEE